MADNNLLTFAEDLKNMFLERLAEKALGKRPGFPGQEQLEGMLTELRDSLAGSGDPELVKLAENLPGQEDLFPYAAPARTAHAYAASLLTAATGKTYCLSDKDTHRLALAILLPRDTFLQACERREDPETGETDLEAVQKSTGRMHIGRRMLEERAAMFDNIRVKK